MLKPLRGYSEVRMIHLLILSGILRTPSSSSDIIHSGVTSGLFRAILLEDHVVQVVFQTDCLVIGRVAGTCIESINPVLLSLTEYFTGIKF